LRTYSARASSAAAPAIRETPFERVRSRQLFRLPPAARINARSEQPARVVASLPREFKSRVGMSAQCEAVLSSIMAKFKAPQLAARRGDLDVQAAAIEQLVRFLKRPSRTYFGHL
jgi:hypothetical protein